MRFTTARCYPKSPDGRQPRALPHPAAITSSAVSPPSHRNSPRDHIVIRSHGRSSNPPAILYLSLLPSDHRKARSPAAPEDREAPIRTIRRRPVVSCLSILSASAKTLLLQRQHVAKDWRLQHALPSEVLRGLRLHQSSRSFRRALRPRHISDSRRPTMALLSCVHCVGDCQSVSG
jgi:hypothetical protein